MIPNSRGRSTKRLRELLRDPLCRPLVSLQPRPRSQKLCGNQFCLPAGYVFRVSLSDEFGTRLVSDGESYGEPRCLNSQDWEDDSLMTKIAFSRKGVLP